MNATNGSSGSIIDEILTELAEDKAAAAKGLRAVSELRAKRTRRGFFGAQALLAIRSGLERGRLREAVDRLAEQESREAASGFQN